MKIEAQYRIKKIIISFDEPIITHLEVQGCVFIGGSGKRDYEYELCFAVPPDNIIKARNPLLRGIQNHINNYLKLSPNKE